MLIWQPRIEFVYVRIAPGRTRLALPAIEQQWHTTYPENPFPFEYTFLDQDLSRLYQSEQQLAQIFGTFAGLAILIACLGLFGLAGVHR